MENFQVQFDFQTEKETSLQDLYPPVKKKPSPVKIQTLVQKSSNISETLFDMTPLGTPVAMPPKKNESTKSPTHEDPLMGNPDLLAPMRNKPLKDLYKPINIGNNVNAVVELS